MKNVLTVVIIILTDVIYTRCKMMKIDLDMDYILKMYFSEECELKSIESVMPQYNRGIDIDDKIVNILKFGDSRKKIATYKLLSLLNKAVAEFIKEVE